MKKSLIALAVLAASGAALAQSSVTVYGIVDAYVGSTKDTTGAAGKTAMSTTAQSQTVVNSGGLKSNRIGFRGTEDLGGGLKATFRLEQRFKSDTGEIDGVQFKGESSVGLVGGFGEVKLGRSDGVYDDLRDATNPIGHTNMSPVADAFKEVKGDYTDKQDNSIAYRSPSFGGFSGGVSYSFGENKAPTAAGATIGAGNTVDLKLQYKDGPLLVGYAFQKQKAPNGTINTTTGITTSTGFNDTAYNLIAASYDFGVVKLVGGYQTAKVEALDVKSGDNKGYYFGVDVPVSANLSLYGAYVNAKWDAVAANADVKATGFSLAGIYKLSKRTSAYVGYKGIKKKDEASTDLGSIKTFAVGVRHNF